MSGFYRCKCGTLIQWLHTVGEKRLPFEHRLVPVDQAADTGWTVIKKRQKNGHSVARVIPYSGVQGPYRKAIQQLLIRHECPLRETT
jgi:hypothetical protein